MRWAVVIVTAAVAGGAARAQDADPATVRRLGAMVRDFREATTARAEAARTLGKLGARASAAVPDLVAVLDRLRGTEQETLQEAIVDALGQIGSAAKPALPSLARATRRTLDLDFAIRNATDQILAASDAQDIDALAQQLQSRDPSLRLRATKALADLGPAARATVPALMVALQDLDGDVRRGAITAIRLIQPNVPPPEALVRAVAADLASPDPTLRLLAARTLGRMGPPASLVAGELALLRADPDGDVRRAAAAAFARVTAAGP
jgi:HEAT repeat protein